MKKIMSIVLCTGAFASVSAQNVVSTTTDFSFVAEGMSSDHAYVAGQNQFSTEPAIWNVATGEIHVFAHEGLYYPPIYDEDTWAFVGYDYDNPQPDTYVGSFHAISKNGLAVGEFGSSYSGEGKACKAKAGDEEVTFLYTAEGEAGSSAYAVSEDGNMIVGFYYDASWVAQACIWKNGGLTAEDRCDLPAPTEEEFGGPIDYVSARWMSADGKVILGYAQDFNNGSWVMVYWTLEADGNYKVHAEDAKKYFTPYGYDEEWNSIYLKEDAPYVGFQPISISANGKWISLSVSPTYDLSDWDAIQVTQSARLNIETGVLQVLDLGEYDGPELYGIADNGVAAGATPISFGPMSELGESMSSVRLAFVWPADCDTIISLQQMFPNEEYFNYDETTGEGIISCISADAKTIVGYTSKTDGIESYDVTSFIATLPEAVGIKNISNSEARDVKKIENKNIVIIRNGVRYNLQGQRI